MKGMGVGAIMGSSCEFKLLLQQCAIGLDAPKTRERCYVNNSKEPRWKLITTILSLFIAALATYAALVSAGIIDFRRRYENESAPLTSSVAAINVESTSASPAIITNEETIPEPATINLVDLTPFTAVHKDITFGHEFEASLHEIKKNDSDNMGNSNYETGFKFTTTSHTIDEYTYILDRKYVIFSGVIAVHLFSKDAVKDRYYMIFTVYGDGNKLYKSEELRGGIRPISFNIDIANVDELKLVIEMDNPDITKSFSTLLLDPQLSSRSY